MWRVSEDRRLIALKTDRLHHPYCIEVFQCCARDARVLRCVVVLTCKTMNMVYVLLWLARLRL